VDAALVARIQSGDQSAFDSLFREHLSRLCQFARRYAGDTPATEIVSEVFLRLWIGREKWNPQTTIRAYLYGAVRRTAIDNYRSTRAEAKRYAIPLGADEVWGMAAPVLPPSVSVEVQETIDLVWQAIATLSEVQQTVMALRWQAQLSWEEIASVMGLSNVAVRKQHSRALAHLRVTLPAYLTQE
jgi:RNA polymerase sigma-70 factor (ECF subfamily)